MLTGVFCRGCSQGQKVSVVLVGNADGLRAEAAQAVPPFHCDLQAVLLGLTQRALEEVSSCVVWMASSADSIHAGIAEGKKN